MSRVCTTCGVETLGTSAAAARFCANCGSRYQDSFRSNGSFSHSQHIPVAVPMSTTQAPASLYPPVPVHSPTHQAPYEPQQVYQPAYSQAQAAPAAYQPQPPAMVQQVGYNAKSVFEGAPNNQQPEPSLFGEAPSYRDQKQRGSSSSEEGQAKGGFLKGRYADHPNCDVCRCAFDIGKRRHQCRKCGQYMCGTCSPTRLLIPPGQQIEGAKGYDESTPQRVCLHCAPQLYPLQDQLAATYARSNLDNAYEPRDRIHVPYTDSLAKECQNAADTISNFFRGDSASSSDRAIPIAFIEKAQGLAIMTIVKAGFMITGKIGTGLVIARLPDGSWSAPSAIGTAGLGGGFQIGGEIVEVMIILGTQGAVEVFHKPQVDLGAGLDIAVGPYGRAASADAALSADTLNANYSYSLSKGLFAGVALQGSVIAARTDLNRKFYGRDLEPKELLNGSVAQPPAARPLYEAIERAMHGIQELRAVQEELSTMMGTCRRCTCPKFVTHVHQVWNKKCKNCDHIH